ncbi:XRE family transcriptional regulator [Candidatus Roizmanbacteria bacterium CG_4_10_14_3_um_filter_39_13]|uniref:XRE family transcriptional regulator n=3 Tax=Candidatus Roizmaniibacteriota TaxID=1752723 RepID=A0A2M7EJQ7_9BACT|nr:MAG: XRE family transcriptional regulator [Candidatus Roizmanbacteria bacterium CG03_land_8_20_14_0_80_39_12]PIV70799.1 MAG: XRE family transcriptional regulator [Candidatus Roizmanbacteria bacterium CG17_big_fil_post_rev_8_21_14_2_50_39_7]PIX68685.1 MAG: XRE family transcriptional regulator [Candidatus Roizmanbacteria bacterium CG_4_10_14_3_um_filter_39_13]
MFYWRTKKQLGDILKRKRIELGFSQECVSLETSIDRMWLSSLENGKANPTLFTLLKLCGVFHIKLWEVLREVNV